MEIGVFILWWRRLAGPFSNKYIGSMDSTSPWYVLWSKVSHGLFELCLGPQKSFSKKNSEEKSK